jgi:hypothetical protein
VRVRACRLTGQDITYVRGLPVTTPARTAVDLAATLPFRNAVVALDSALDSSVRSARVAKPLELAAFDAALERRRPLRSSNQVARVRSFVDGCSDSPGESLSRVMMFERGWPKPVLQHPFSDREGKIGDVDFWWPEVGVIGEFDGYVRHSRGEKLGGRTPAAAAFDEKKREDRLRAHPDVRGVARWTFGELSKPSGLDTVLFGAGLRRRGREPRDQP